MSYRDHPALSQSEIKRVISSSFGEAKESSAMRFGSLVDMMITQESELDDTYAIIDSSIGDKPKTIVDEIIDNQMGVVPIRELDKKYVLDLMNKHEYNNRYKNPSDERRYNKFYEESELYYNERRESNGKVIITQEDWDNAIWVRDNILNGQFTQGFHQLPEWCEVHNQLEIYWSAEGVDVKSALDRVIVNKGKGFMIGNYMIPARSILPIDYKVLERSTRYFNMRKFRYDIQGSFYSEALKFWMLEQNLYDYELLPFHFIVGGVGQTSYVHVLSDVDRQIGEWGGRKVPTDSGYEVVPSTTFNIDPDILKTKFDLDVLGWRQGINLYKWYMEHHAEMQYDKEAIENNGIFQSNIYSL